jgi:hypothetical protein
MEWTVHPGGFVPFEHVHTRQDEIFHVQAGEIHAKINGQSAAGKAGDVIAVPRGSKHIASNGSSEKLVCTVEYKPGLDHYTTMQCFAGLTLDRDLDRRGLVNIPKIMYLLRRADARSLPRPAFLPDLVFGLAMNFFFVYGRFAGWEKLFWRYTA